MKSTLPELQIFAEVYGLRLAVADNPKDMTYVYAFCDSTGKRYSVELADMITEEKLNSVLATAADHFGIVLN